MQSKVHQLKASGKAIIKCSLIPVPPETNWLELSGRDFSFSSFRSQSANENKLFILNEMKNRRTAIE